MTKFKEQILVAVIAALVGALAGAICTFFVSIALLSPRPIADLRCYPQEIEVGELITCENHSLYTNYFQWKFGDDRAFDTHSKEPIKHRFQTPGEKSVTLTAIDRDGRDHAIDHAVVTVLVPRGLRSAISLSIYGILPASSEVATRSIHISETKDDHPDFIWSDSRSYERIFDAAPGFHITKADIVKQSDAQVSDLILNILEGGRRVSLTFRLTSGPKTSQWRGWLDGQVMLTEERLIASSEVPVVENIIVDRLGSYSLPPAADISRFSSFLIKDKSGQIIAQGSSGSYLLLTGTDIAVLIGAKNKAGYFEIRRTS